MAEMMDGLRIRVQNAIAELLDDAKAEMFITVSSIGGDIVNIRLFVCDTDGNELLDYGHKYLKKGETVSLSEVTIKVLGR